MFLIPPAPLMGPALSTPRQFTFYPASNPSSATLTGSARGPASNLPTDSPTMSPRGPPESPRGPGQALQALLHPQDHQGMKMTADSAVFSIPAAIRGSTQPMRICVYGDSMTAGFPAYEPYAKFLASTLAAAGLSVEIVGCGLCGLAAVEMARGLDAQQLRDKFGRVGIGLRRLLAEENPFDLVLIMAGTNDLGVPHSSSEEVLACLESMHKACWAVGTPSLALSIPESSVTGTTRYPEAAKKWHAINNGLAAWGQVAQGENPCNRPFFLNTAELVSYDIVARMQGLWDPDTVHFTAAGSKEFGTKLAPSITSHLITEGRANSTVTEDSVATNASGRVGSGLRRLLERMKSGAARVATRMSTKSPRKSTSKKASGHRKPTPRRSSSSASSTSTDASGHRQISPERATSAAARTDTINGIQTHGSQEGTVKKSLRASCDPLAPCGLAITFRHQQSGVAVY